MAHDLEKSIDICLTCQRRFSSIAEAREAFRELGSLTVEHSDAIARKRRLNPMTIRGLVMISRYACMALDWLDYHHQPLTQWHLRQLEAEFKGADCKRDVLKWELHTGASEVLRKVDWQPVAN